MTKYFLNLCSTSRKTVERRLAKPMFWLAVVYLALLAGLVHRVREFETTDRNTAEAWFLLGGLLLLWPVFLTEAIVRFYLHDRSRRNWKTLAACLGTGLVPPLRMAVRSPTDPERMWLPWLGWRKADFDLQKTLEHFFGAPMLFMALMILPVLIVEYGWSDAVAANPTLRLVLAVGIAIIWFAFATEFIIRIAAADSKRDYAFRNWIDLAVVLLPMFEFLPFLRVVRLTRVMRLETLFAWIKYYRLYGVAGKGWRGLVVLQLLKRSPEARLMRLQARVESKEQERRELDRELDYYRRKIEALRQEAASGGPDV